MRNYSLRSSNHSIHQLLPPAKTLPMKLRSTHCSLCLLSHNEITTCINLHLFCEICFWTLIEIFCFYTIFIIFVRWRLSVGIKRFIYLLTYLQLHKNNETQQQRVSFFGDRVSCNYRRILFLRIGPHQMAAVL